ncbi:MAG: transcription antitermination factor NusB, partial [Actinomycetaceae bacterium]|nr:transcription antitermination factor NusB [Actinomycetaceae bacterium]
MRSRGFTSRTRARKRAVDTIFEADQRGLGDNPQDLREVLEDRQHITAAQTPLPTYAIEAVEGVIAHLFQIDDLIAMHCTARSYDRIPPVDRAVMRVAVWEMLWNDDVPPITAIDEAVRIVKEISTDDSPALVNAILDAIRGSAPDALAADAALSAAFDTSSAAD